MNGYYFDVYFDPAELEISRDGSLRDYRKLHIIRFDEEGNAIDRVDENGTTIPEPLPTDDVLQMEHAGFGDDYTPQESLDRFEDWLDDHTVWVRVSRETLLQPAEFDCIGIAGYTDDGNPY